MGSRLDLMHTVELRTGQGKSRHNTKSVKFRLTFSFSSCTGVFKPNLFCLLCVVLTSYWPNLQHGGRLGREQLKNMLAVAGELFDQIQVSSVCYSLVTSSVSTCRTVFILTVSKFSEETIKNN